MFTIATTTRHFNTAANGAEPAPLCGAVAFNDKGRKAGPARTDYTAEPARVTCLRCRRSLISRSIKGNTPAMPTTPAVAALARVKAAQMAGASKAEVDALLRAEIAALHANRPAPNTTPAPAPRKRLPGGISDTLIAEFSGFEAWELEPADPEFDDYPEEAAIA